jgi:3-methyladenine DNA glycosylase AlkC
MFERSDDHKAKGVALGVLSYCGLSDYHKAVPFFERAAASPDWNLREHAQMLFRKLIERWPEEAKADLLRLAGSDDPNLRRFVSETLRPVQENRWFYSNPDYPLGVLRRLFREDSPYPRTSVGNNLSDLARRLPELVYDLVGELVRSGDENSHWIAARACRNLVRQDPVRVMDLLGVDEYRYKDRVYKRSDCQGS